MVLKRWRMESEIQVTGGGPNAEATALREQLLRAQEAGRRLTSDNEKLKEELQRRNDLLEKKDSAHAAQVRRLEAAENKIRELVRSESEADYKSRTLSAKMAAAEKGLEDALTSRRALEKKLQNSQQQINELTIQVQSQGGRLEELRSVSEQRSQSADTLEQQNRDLEAKLARAVGKLELYQGKVQSLQRSISDRETEMVLNQQKSEITGKERDVTRVELEEARKQAKTYRDGLAEMEQSLTTHRRQLAETEESFERTRVALQRSDKVRQDREEELASTRAQLETTRQELELEREQSSSLAEQVVQLESELVEESESLARQLDAKKKELEELSEQLLTADRSSASDRTIAQTLRKEREALAADLEERTAQLRELKSFAERVKPAYETLKERYSELQSESKAQANELEELRLKLSSTQTASSSLDSQHKELETRWKTVRSERDELEKVKARLEAELADMEMARQAEQEELEETGEENGRLTDELLDERQQHRAARAELSQAQQSLAALEARLAETEIRLIGVSQERDQSRLDGEALSIKLEAESKRSEDAERELEMRRRQLGKLVEDLKHQQAISAKSQSNVKELLKQRTQLLEHKKQLENLLSAGGEATAEAKQRLTLLDADKEALESALAELQNDHDLALAERDSRFRALERRLEEESELAAQRVRELESKLEDQTAKADRQMSELEATLEAEVALQEERQAALQEDLYEREQSLLELQASMDAEIAERDERLLEVEHLLGEAVSEHALTRQEREAEQVAAIERESELAATIDDSRAVRSELETALDMASAEEMRLQETIGQLEDDLEKLRSKQASLQQELAQERAQGGHLLEELAKRKAEGADLRDETLQLQATIETMESELRARQEESSYQIEQRVTLEATLSTLEGKTRELESQLDRSQREALGLREYIDKFQKASKDRLEQAKAALSTREQQINRLREAVAARTKQASTAEARLERSQLAENSLRGALMDLRHLLASREEMVEELEWHLGLVYQTLEDGQNDLDARTGELEGARERLRTLIFSLEEKREESGRLSKSLALAEEQREQAQTELERLRADHEQTVADLENERRQLTHALDKFERSTQRLQRAQADLVEEQERSARLGAQLTDALEDRNRSVVRLRDLQQEFQDWRDAQHSDGTDLQAPPSSSGAGEEALALASSLARQTALEQELEELREALDDAIAHRDLEESQELESLRAALSQAQSERDEGLRLELEELRRSLAEAQVRTPADSTASADESELLAQLAAERERAHSLQSALQDIREELAASLTARQAEEAGRREALAALRSAEESRDLSDSDRDTLLLRIAELESTPVDVSGFEEDLLRGFDLGSDLVSSQLEFLAAEERKNDLAKQMDRAINLEALNALVEDLRDADAILKDRQTEFEDLERQWNEFHSELDDTSQLLLLKFTGLIEYEMREARQATEKSQALSLELDEAEARFRRKYESLERQLEEKDLINGELEEELAQLANQAAELGEQLAVAESDDGEEVSWKALSDIKQQLKEKSELIELYRREHETSPDKSQETLEEQLQLLSERYVKGSARISEMLELISTRDQRLAELEQDVSGTSVFKGTLLSGSKLVQDLGLVTPHPGADNELAELGEELERSRADLQETRVAFEKLQREQKADEAALAAKRIAIGSLAGSGGPEIRERLQLEIVVLINQLANREEELRLLSLDLDDDGPGHRTAEDMPAVGDSRVIEFSDSSESV